MEYRKPLTCWRLLDTGSQSQVYSGKTIDSNQHAVAKVFFLECWFIAELELSKQLNGPMFPQVLQVTEYEGKHCIIYERLGDSLYIYLDLSGGLSIQSTIQVGLQLL